MCGNPLQRPQRRSADVDSGFLFTALWCALTWSSFPHAKRYVKTRRFGGYSNRHRQRYISECRDLLKAEALEHIEPQADSQASDEPSAAESSDERVCLEYGAAMYCIAATDRASWSVIMSSLARPTWYDDG